MTLVTNIFSWQSTLANEPHQQKNFGPLDVGGFDRLLFRGRLARPQSGPYDAAYGVRFAVLTGDTLALGSGVADEPVFDLNNHTGTGDDPRGYASVADVAFASPDPGAGERPAELRWAVPCDDRFALIGIATRIGYPLATLLSVDCVGVIGGTDQTAPHQIYNGALLDVEQPFTFARAFAFNLPPYGGDITYRIASSDPAVNVLLETSTNQITPPATTNTTPLLNAPGVTGAKYASGVLTIPWAPASIVVDAGAATMFPGTVDVQILARRF